MLEGYFSQTGSSSLVAKVDAGKATISKGISSFLSTTAGQITAAVGVFALMYAGIQKLSDKYNLSYDSAIKNTKESISSLESTQQEIDSLNSKADQYKEKLVSIGKNYKVDLSGKNSVSEMITTLQELQKVGNIDLSLVDQTEIEKIQMANSELERTKKLKENLLEAEQIEAAENAKDSLKRGKQSVAKQVEKSVPGADKRGTPAWAVGNVNVTTAITEDVEAIEKYQDEISKLEKKQSGYKPDSKKYKNAQKDIDSYRDAIEKLQKDLSSKQADASDLLKAFSKDGTGSAAASKYKKEFKEVKEALDAVAEMDMTPTEKKLNKLDDFFNSSSNSGIRDALLEAAKNGENVNDVLGRMGLKLKDIGKGVSADDLTKYFDDIKRSAEDASDAVDDVNNSLTMSDISEAFESKNAGDDYVSLSDYLTKAKDLYDKGLTGTDDFKSVAEAISYNVDSSTETFKKNYDKLQRYFTKDNDGNLTASGVSNFLNDLKSLNKGYAEFDENTGKWQLNMSNTAQAAKDMGMSVQVFEAMLGRIQDYDNVGDFKFESAIKQFNDAKDALSELNDLYDSMEDGENKEALKANLDKWTPQIENAENDLASLPKEVVTQLKFEYSRQELMKKAQDAMDAAKNSGWNDVTTNANAITANDKAKTKMVSTIDMSKVQEKIPVYFDAENAIQNLQAQLASGNLSEKQTVKVQAEVANLQSLQNEILSAFHDAHPEITAETNTDQATKTFQDWISSAEGQEVITKVTGDNKDALEKINELVDKDYNTKIKSEFDGSGAEKGAKETKDKIESEEVTMKGKVDLTNRPQIPASKLSDVGWENAGDGTATVFSSSYSNEAGDKTVVVTPILPNGDVFEPGALEEYAQNLLDGGDDSEGLEIRTYVGDDSIEKANKYAEALHQVQDAYYLGDDAQKQALSSLQDFNDEQLKAIDLSDGKYSEGEQQLESLMNSLGVGKESLSEFVDVLSDMGLIKVTAEVDAEDNATPVINKVSEAQIKEKIAQITGKDAATPVLTTWNTLSADDKFASLTADDQATIAVELWNGLSADPKFTELSAEDQATTIVNLWNAMNANPKFSELSAQDKATATVQTYNALSLKDKNSLISQSGGETAIGVASKVASVINSIPPSRKSVITLTTIKETINKVVTQAGNVKHANGGSIAGGATQLNGTAHVSGTVIPKLSRRALAMGTLQDDSWLKPQWMTQKDEVALTGEKNEELVVNPRLNRWYTVGTNGAEFAHIPAGSVVFNGRQTKELLSKGYTNSRAKGNPNLSSLPALLNGTAYLGSSTGGFSFSGGASKYNTGSSSKKNTTSKKSSTKSNTSSKSSSGSSNNSSSTNNSSNSSSAEKSEEFLDWIETLLSRVSRLTELATNAVDRAVGLANKQNALVNAVTKTQNEITANQNAANKYFAQANSLGLSQGYVNKIKNGTLDIESITDDNLKDKISKYKDYYEKGLSAQDKVLDLQDKLNELYQKRLEIIEKEYDTIVEVNDSLKDMLDARISYNSAYGVANDNQDNIDSINKSIKAQKDSISQLTKKLDAYQKEVNSQISSGKLKQGSEDYRSAQKNLNDFTANIYKASQELIELQDKLVQLRVDAIQTIIDTFQRRSDKLDKYASLLEAKDETVPESVYQERLDNNNDTIRKNQKARAIWLKRQSTEDVNSDNYKKYAEEIQKLDESTLDLLKDNEDLKNSIYSLRIKNLEDAVQAYDDLETELKGFRDLLDEDAFLDKNGGITDDGLAQITLLSQSIGNTKQKISDLTTGLQKVKELYDNGVISLKEYNDKSAEYRKEIQSSTSDVKSYQKSLTDLYQNALKAEVDALNKVIEKRKKAQDGMQSYYEFQKKISSQTNDVNALKSQIAALEGVNDAATLAKKKKLEQDLKDKQDELDSTKRDHRNELISEGYDKISSDMSDMLEDTEYEITHNADKQNEIIQTMLNKQIGMYQEAYNKINSIIKNTGWVGSDDFNNNQSQMSSQTGAQNQASNASQSQSQANKNPSSSASGTDTSGIKDNASKNEKITEDIMKPENTTNRPVAELTVSKSSVSIEEGKSTSVTTKIRPNDAANKKLSWKSSNTAIATVSNGTISGKKPGSCQVTVSTTDGSGISKTIAVTVTKKPEPPKPATPSNKGGDGVPRVGDVVTFNGKYYYDSWGKRPAGALYSGVKNGVVIDNLSSRDYGGSARYTGNLKVHIKSADGRYGNLGWVGLNQISGYATGTLGVDRDQIAIVDENGQELVVPNPKAGRITKLEKGTGVIPNPATEKLVNMTNNLDDKGNMVINGRTIEEYVNDMANMQSIAVPDFSDVTASVIGQLDGKGMGNVTVENHYDSLLNVEGNIDKDALPGLQEMLKQSYEYTSKRMVKELGKVGVKIRR